MNEYRFEIKGVTSLIMHADNIVEADALEQWRKAPENKDMSKSGDDRTPPWSWQAALYHDGEHVAIPQANILRTLRDAGARIPIKGKKTYKDMTQIGLRIPDFYCRFRIGGDENGEGHQIAIEDILKFRTEPFAVHIERCKALGFELFVKRAAIQRNKHVRVRPMFKVWTIDGDIQVTEDAITYDLLTKFFDLAGRYSGLGDWRPSSKTPGPYGLFSSRVEPLS